MKIGMKRLSTIMLLALLTISVTAVFALPQMPHQFYGDVYIDGLPAPDGVWIDAYIDGVLYYTTWTSEGSYGWDELFKFPADDPDTWEIEGGVAGDWVDFYVDHDFYADSCYFENGALTWLDLEVTTTVYELQVYEGWNLIGIPFIPDDPSIEVMLWDIMANVESVWAYDGETGYWSSYSPYAPSDLTEILDGKGYWIKMICDDVWKMDI